MQLSDRQIKVAIVLLVVFAIGIGYFAWTRSASPEPTLPQGQSIQNPFGTGGPKQQTGVGAPTGGSGKRSTGLPPGTP